MSGTRRHTLGTGRESTQCVEPHGGEHPEQAEHSIIKRERNRYKEWCAGRNRAVRVPPVPETQIVDSGEIPGVGSKCGTTDSESADASHADHEFARFEQVAERTETGGLRDPNLCSAELAEKLRLGGVSWEAVEKSEIDYASLRRGAAS